jgi:hypothetical protein
MSPRQLILLSPYRLPTETTLYMGDEEVSAILNGHQALWHPAALALAASLPRIAQPHEHEEPSGDCVYALPDNPPLMLSEDWAERARAAGAVVFTATQDRQETLDNLRAALAEAGAAPTLLDLAREKVGPFLGVGFGCLVLEALFEAMSHENVLPAEDVFQDLSAAIAHLDGADPEAWRQHVQSAAERLLASREVLYPVTLHLIDLFLVDAERPADGWPAALSAGQPVNVVAAAQLLERLARDHPERLAELREKVGADLAQVLGGYYREREDPLLPLESQLWSLVRGQAVYRELLGQEVRVCARQRFGYHPQTPLLLQGVGITHALLLSFDDGQVPSHHSVVVSWPSHNGKQVDAFTRAPQPADSPQTYFHLAHHLHQTIMQDQSATLALLHRGRPASPWYEDWLVLTRFAPVLGRWVTLSDYFNEVVGGDYTAAASPDEFSADYLSERTLSTSPARGAPVSAFAAQVRSRRRLDAAWTFATILRTLGGRPDEVEGRTYLEHLAGVENRFEGGEDVGDEAVLDAQQRSAEALARRLVARGPADSPGWLLLNPCAFTRRVAVELTGLSRPLPPSGPVKACQMDGDLARLVVEVPPLGFAWVPRGAPDGPAPATRMKLADERAVRNEFFEAEIDPQTGGLRGIRDQKLRIGRMGQQLVWNPGSTMKATRVEVTSAGPALGEVVSEGVLVDDAGAEIASFRQRFRAWLGRPLLELRIEIEPRQPVEGYAWHSYFGARFAWREESATLVRGTTGLRSVTSQNRPETPDYLEVRVGRQSTVLFPGGLPFHQRHGSRMLDVLLVCEGEQGRAFDLGIGLDREQPMQTALGLVSPVGVVATTQGPPHVGAAGWLYHLDASNLLLTSLRPAPEHPDGLLATILEGTGAGGPTQFRCVRDPVRAVVQDLSGTALIDVPVQGDAVELEVSANELLQLRVEFS